LARFIPTPMQLLGWGMGAIGVLCLVIVTWFWVSHATPQTPGDTHNYILAGLRLNAGHPLYAYGPVTSTSASSTPRALTTRCIRRR
jgi:hypothetical protein